MNTKHYQIDFRRINTHSQFYVVYAQQVFTKVFFGKNLDALYDSLTSDLEYPCQFQLIFVDANHRLEFQDVIRVFEHACEYLDDMAMEICYRSEW